MKAQSSYAEKACSTIRRSTVAFEEAQGRTGYQPRRSGARVGRLIANDQPMGTRQERTYIHRQANESLRSIAEVDRQID